jgi:hypothetical protein
VVVDGEARGRFKYSKDVLDLMYSIRAASKEDKGVVGVLNDRARSAINEGVAEGRGEGSVVEQAVKNINDNDEEVRGQRITLLEASATNDPSSWDTVEEDRRLPSLKQGVDPGAPV